MTTQTANYCTKNDLSFFRLTEQPNIFCIPNLCCLLSYVDVPWKKNNARPPIFIECIQIHLN